MKRRFTGTYTAIVTPFSQDGSVDYDAFKRLVEFQIEHKVDGIVPCGTTGESPTLSDNEKKELIKVTVEIAGGRCPVIAGTGSNNTEHAIEMSKWAQENGVDGVLIVNPYYNKPTQKGLYLHFKSIADQLNISVIVYNIKGRTSVNVETNTLVQLMNDCANIIAVKEASGDINQMKEVIKHKKEGFCVLSGDDAMTLDLIEAGGDGVISVASNIMPGFMSKMVRIALEGKLDEAREIDNELLPLFDVEFIETNPIPVKTMLAMQGKIEENFRLPMCSLEKEEHRLKIKKVMEQLPLA